MVRIVKFIRAYLIGLASCLYLFTFGSFVKRHREFLSSIVRHFGFEKKAGPFVEPRLPQKPLSQVIRKNHAIRIMDPVFHRGATTLDELCVINQVIRDRNPLNLFEMGTLEGRTTLNMAANSSETAHVYTLDLPREQIDQTKFELDAAERFTVDKERSGAHFADLPEEGKITQLYGDTATFDFGPYFNKMDFVFIDASHTYDYVLNDSKAAMQLLKKDGKGIIVWDDYAGCPGVTQVLNELWLTDPAFKNLYRIEGTELACLEMEPGRLP